MEIMQTLHFLRPQWFWAFMPMMMFAALIYFKPKRLTNWQKVIDRHLLDELIIRKQTSKRWFWFLLLFLSWSIAIIALAGPTWRHQPQAVYKNKNALMLVVDLSNKMFATDLNPNRMTRMLYKINDVLRSKRDGQIGMVAFAKEAYTVSPLTEDNATIIAMLDELSPNIMPVQGENLSAAMQKAYQLLMQANAPHGSILLLTAAKPKPKDFVTANTIYQQGTTISVLAIGNEDIATAALAKLARAGGGRFANFSNDNSDINSLLHPNVFRDALAKTKGETAITTRWYDQGRYFLFLLIPLVLLAFRKGILEEMLT